MLPKSISMPEYHFEILFPMNLFLIDLEFSHLYGWNISNVKIFSLLILKTQSCMVIEFERRDSISYRVKIMCLKVLQMHAP